MAGTNPLEELLKQPREAREAAIDALLDSLEDESVDEKIFDDPAIAQAWHEEIERRIQHREPGIPAETVFAEGLARLNKRP